MKKLFYLICILLLLFSCSTNNKIKLNLSTEKEHKIMVLSFKRFAEMNSDVKLDDIDKYCFDINMLDNKNIYVYISPKDIILGGDAKIMYDNNFDIIFEQYGE
ncbi:MULTISPECIES: hypothetical protein [unclassified Treponema]|uniref:hypothetical protein n=1 Tax=unclassified Treponema TaxID=2638727 RepID=UPI0020A608C1|nr:MULTISPECIES: hypothetical protein [unclassified Treponema]UTC66237.1 hypothetical protein E4O06_09510 [Treponema sp. OMZ 789]UTC68965.1 hypothetical protein E4O01_09645 [Treponema sp. OMZ 790]UTC71692.1 hypothetical protein E4O02_09835 [Treponema sp. OMZ 791]